MFLATKLAAPRARSRWVPRQRLLSRLGVPPRFRVNLVHAGAGFGKTALLAQWQHELACAGIPTAWLSVDRNDDDIHVFIAYLAAAINRACPEVGRDVIELVSRRGRQVPAATLKVLLANAITDLKSALVLIVDDFHFLGSDEIHEWMTDFVTRAPDNLSVAVAARSFPPQGLSRLRATGQMEEIGPDDLALTYDEVGSFMEGATDARLEPSDVDTLHEHTEGWAAGLQMVAIALRSRQKPGNPVEALSGTTRSVNGYLQEEVFARLPEKLRDFLMRAAILGRFSAEVCAAVTGETEAGRMIAEAERRELFILPLDVQGCWYRFHHLFSDFLLVELDRQKPGELRRLHVRASEWFAREECWREALHHSIEAGDMEQAIEVANRCAMSLVRDGDYFVLQTLLANLPADLHRRSVHLRLAEAWTLALNGQGDEVDRVLREIDLAAEAGGQGGAVRPEMRAIRATLAYVQDDSTRLADLLHEGPPTGAGSQPWVDDVIKVAASVDHLWHRRFAEARDFSPCVTLFKRVYQLSLFGVSWWYEGRIAEAEAQWQSAADLADGEAGSRSLAAMVPRIWLARLDYERGRFDSVERALAGRVGMLEETCPTDLMASASESLGWTRAARGDVPGAMAVFDRMRLIGAERGWLRMEATAIIELMRLVVRSHSGQADHLARRLQSIMPAAASEDDSNHWLGSRLCTLGVAFHRAMTSLDEEGTRAVAVVAGEIWTQAPPLDGVTAQIMLAQVLHEHGQRERALEAMGRALGRAQELGIARTFVDSGDWALSLVRELRTPEGRAATDLEDAYLDGLLQMSGTEPAPARPAAGATPGLVEALTAREREILALVSRGLSNKEVGRSLKIGPETVKWHLKNLFGKLGVTTRYQAVKRAQALAGLD